MGGRVRVWSRELKINIFCWLNYINCNFGSGNKIKNWMLEVEKLDRLSERSAEGGENLLTIVILLFH